MAFVTSIQMILQNLCICIYKESGKCLKLGHTGKGYMRSPCASLQHLKCDFKIQNFL
jgi:hypothetical protein